MAVDTESLYWQLKEADEEILFKTMDRLIKEGNGKEVAQVAARIINNIRSTRDVFERECSMADREIELLEAKNRKYRKFVDKVQALVNEAPTEDNNY